jgi:LuxR family maltose regulon positive regulatory protein
MSVQDVLIATKFHLPAAGADIIPRPRLFRLLDQGLHQPLTLLSAPPGFGKTMLLANWIYNRGNEEALKIGWLSIDESDNNLDIFWRYFIASIQRVCPQVGEIAAAMLASPTSPDIQTVLGGLINELADEPAPILVVLDDYHLIHSPEIHHSLAFLLDHLPPTVHLVLLTREDPPLNLARRRARRQVVEIRASDLRFDLPETVEFVNETQKLGLTPKQIEILEHRTEGWIAGLQMAALSLQGRDAQSFFESFSGDNRYIADYLIEEVLQLQDEAVRQFLLKTSILERLSVSLCAALIGDASTARDMLDHLEHANLFLVPLDSRREWYRYHHLFMDLLRNRLSDAFTVNEIAGLHRKVSAWFEEQGDISATVRHACQIPDISRAIELLEQNAGLFFTGNELPQLVELARGLPVEQIKDHPNLCMAVAWASLAITDPQISWLEFIERHFALPAEIALKDDHLDPNLRAALLEVLIVRQQTGYETYQQGKRAYLLALQRQLDSLPADQMCLFNTVASLKPIIQFDLGLDAEQAGDADDAARYFNETVTLARNNQNHHLLQLSLSRLANTQVCQAHLQTARQTYEQALTLYTTGSASPYAALAHAGLSALHYEWGDFTAAERHLQKGLPLAHSWSHWDSLVPLKLTLARLEARRGDLQKAISILDNGMKPPLDGMRLPLEAYANHLRLRDSDHDSASAWLAAHAPVATLEMNPANESFLLDVARILTGLSRFDESIALAQKIILFAQKGGRTHTLIQAKAILAKTLSLSGNIGGAMDSIVESLQLAAPEHYLSTFVDEGIAMRDLLNSVKNKVPLEQRYYVEKILAGFGVGENQPIKREAGNGRRPERVEGSDLSEREREIMGLIAEGLSNQEIAERLVISITTVKTHVGNIFNKFGVTSRTQALARAAELGLLPRR